MAMSCHPTSCPLSLARASRSSATKVTSCKIQNSGIVCVVTMASGSSPCQHVYMVSAGQNVDELGHLYFGDELRCVA